MKTIAIIGAGFTGTMVAAQMIRKSTQPLRIILIDKSANLNKGIAYIPYSEKHLLNVVAAKMSAYPDQPDHFLDWVMTLDAYKELDKTFIANTFLPRKIYGSYLQKVWEDAKKIAVKKGIHVNFIDHYVEELTLRPNSVELVLNNQSNLVADQCVIATGNNLPRNPNIKNMDFYTSSNYFRNPWIKDSVKNLHDHKMPVLIIGNGLTMVDTVFSLREEGFKGVIYSISPNGFNILPHRHNGLKYPAITDEIVGEKNLYTLFILVKKHVHKVRNYGVSAEPVIDSLRPFTQMIWQEFSDDEKAKFMSRFRHLWGVARHRIPINSHDKIQQMRIEGQLKIISGNLINMTDRVDYVTVEFFNKKNQTLEYIGVSRIINCTGPETNIDNLDSSFLKQCLIDGVLTQDNLKLGINTDVETFQVISKNGKRHQNLFTVGSNLKGILWESTAVNELREQAAKLAESLIKHENVLMDA